MTFGVGSRLSAAAALQHRWPPWTFFASCFAGGVRQSSGSEPLGLAIACMIGGSRAVIGGVIEVENEATARILTEVAGAVVAGAHPAAALRRSQLAMVDRRAGTALVREWAGLVCISTDLPDEDGRGDDSVLGKSLFVDR